VKANEIGTGGSVVVVVVEVDVLLVVVVSPRAEVEGTLAATFELFAVVTTPWSRFAGGLRATGGKVTGHEIGEDSEFEQATNVRHTESAVSRPSIPQFSHMMSERMGYRLTLEIS
jgi:flagellar biogenesis protein FliO